MIIDENTKLNYSSSINKFISDLIKNERNMSYNRQTMGIFQKLQMIINNKELTKIPQSELEKQHPQEMNIIAKLKKFITNNNEKLTIDEIFYYTPEFKHLLFLYNPEAFLSVQAFCEEMI